jgi:maleate cis-trans isomerase
MVPAEVGLTHEGLGLLRDSYENLAGQTDQIVERAVEFVKRNGVDGLLVTGGFVTLFNPALQANVAAAVGMPVCTAVSSVVAALHVLSCRRVMLVTPFAQDLNAVIAKHLGGEGLTACFGPAFDKDRKPGAGVDIEPDELLRRVEDGFRRNPGIEAVYFQGATLDPLPIIHKLEERLNAPVVTSNTAMIWNVLSKLGLRFSIAGYGKLLFSWTQ